jgi:hypothetical protein
LRETVSNGFLLEESLEKTVEDGSKNHFVELDHRAKAAVLMRSLRVPPLE